MSADGAQGAQLDDLTVVIPTLNAARSLGATLISLGEATGIEVIVADGGSTDATVTVALGRGATVMSVPPGRGVQMRGGARRAGGPWLLFLHADTVLQAGWSDTVRAWIERPSAVDGYAVFGFRLDTEDPRARLLERLVSLRIRWLGLPYGDQGLLIHRSLYDQIGGYADLPLMEDVDLVRRLGRRRLSVLNAVATTSAERWRRDGWARRSLRNVVCLTLFRLGVSPRRIARFYAR